MSQCGIEGGLADSRAGNLNLDLSPGRINLARLLGKEVDLVNARQVSTVFQKEIIADGPWKSRVISTGSGPAATLGRWGLCKKTAPFL